VRRASGSDGSAYLVTILALALLTGIALAAVLSAQTEMSIGANERSLQRLFYGAQSGLASALGRALAAGDHDAGALRLVDSERAWRSLDVTWTRVHPVLISPCDLCDAQETSAYGAVMRRVVYAVTARARVSGVGPRWAGDKVLSTLLEVQPWPEPSPDELSSDEDSLRKIEL